MFEITAKLLEPLVFAIVTAGGVIAYMIKRHYDLEEKRDQLFGNSKK